MGEVNRSGGTCARRPVFLAAVGDANSPVTWSGIPYHFLQAARSAGVVDEGLALSTDSWTWKPRRWAWNLGRVATGDRLGGYQYSPTFLEKLWAPVRSRIRGAVVLNCFQLYPPSIVADSSVDKWFFIDQTLLQLFEHYGIRPTIGRRIAKDALAREVVGYRAAAGIVVHSKWAANSVIHDYRIDSDKVHVAVAGANIDEELYACWEAQAKAPDAVDGRPVRFVFVGKDWWRKGLDRLLRAFAIARAKGLHATLRVMGCARESLPADLRDISGVEWVGFVDKRRDALRFLNLVAECDVGCLLSRAEAGGIVQREFHALGLAILGTDVGGAPEHRFAEASVGLPGDARDEQIAEALLGLASNRKRLSEMRAYAWNNRRRALWGETVGKLAGLWGQARGVPGQRRSGVPVA